MVQVTFMLLSVTPLEKHVYCCLTRTTNKAFIPDENAVGGMRTVEMQAFPLEFKAGPIRQLMTHFYECYRDKDHYRFVVNVSTKDTFIRLHRALC